MLEKEEDGAILWRWKEHWWGWSWDEPEHLAHPNVEMLTKPGGYVVLPSCNFFETIAPSPNVSLRTWQ